MARKRHGKNRDPEAIVEEAPEEQVEEQTEATQVSGLSDLIKDDPQSKAFIIYPGEDGNGFKRGERKGITTSPSSGELALLVENTQYGDLVFKGLQITTPADNNVNPVNYAGGTPNILNSQEHQKEIQKYKGMVAAHEKGGMFAGKKAAVYETSASQIDIDTLIERHNTYHEISQQQESRVSQLENAAEQDANVINTELSDRISNIEDQYNLAVTEADGIRDTAKVEADTVYNAVIGQADSDLVEEKAEAEKVYQAALTAAEDKNTQARNTADTAKDQAVAKAESDYKTDVERLTTQFTTKKDDLTEEYNVKLSDVKFSLQLGKDQALKEYNPKLTGVAKSEVILGDML